jgi:putative nucleotidyltransferase with HDIG domain
VAGAVYDLSSVVLAAAAAGILDALARYPGSTSRTLLTRGLELTRELAVLTIVGTLHATFVSGIVIWYAGETAFIWAAVFGLTYSLMDIGTIAASQALLTHAPLLGQAKAMMARLLPIYLVHAAMAGVVLRIYPVLGVWGFWTAVPLTLVLQNSFSMYLRVRRAYSETITSLARAGELDRAELAGHSRRVADLSVAVGRSLGFSGEELQDLAYAAMLHDIGRIGLSEDAVAQDHARRGAEIVESIPFLRGAAPLVARHHDVADEAPLGAVIVGVCSEYDHARSRIGVEAAIRMVADGAIGKRATVSAALEATVRRFEPAWGVLV